VIPVATARDGIFGVSCAEIGEEIGGEISAVEGRSDAVLPPRTPEVVGSGRRSRDPMKAAKEAPTVAQVN